MSITAKNAEEDATQELPALTGCQPVSFGVHGDCVAVNRGAGFVQHLVLSRSARQNKALDPTALAGCPQASLHPSAVLAGQRRDSTAYSIISEGYHEHLF